WEKLRLNLPTVPVHDLRVTDKDLVVGTMGRSAWILDDVAALRTRSAVAETAKVHLFAPPPATLWGIRSGAKLPGAGENPPHGATITYWLKEDAPASGVKIEILDGKGAVIAELQGEKPKDAPPEPEVPESFPKRPLPAKKGMHRVTWNFAELPPDRIPRGALDAGNLSVGPRALPGRYVVRLSASGQKSNAALVLERDPRSAVSAEQLAEQHRFATTVKDDLGKLTYAVQRIRLVRKQLADRNGVLKETKTGKELVADSAKLIAALEDLEGKLHNPKAKVVYDILAFKGGAQLYSQMASLYSFATDAEGAPTQGMKEVFDGYRKRLGAALDEVEKTFSGAVERNQALAAKGKLPGIVIPPAKKPAPEPEAPPRKQKPVEKKPKEKKKPKKNAPPKGSSGS
ncbi:MAG TPA: hypothetical protein VNC50_21000, partial [Planctomycetia bacterium]|nr:hypothetical protein [Planctomycetia bacterium]